MMMPLNGRDSSQQQNLVVWRSNIVEEILFYRGTGLSHPYPRHWHNELHVCVYTQGSGYLACRGSSHLVHSGDLVVTPPGEVHENWVTRGSTVSFCSAYIDTSLVRATLRQITEGEDRLPDFPSLFP